MHLKSTVNKMFQEGEKDQMYQSLKIKSVIED